MIQIAHLYPDALSSLGDRGNLLALTQRLKWRGLAFQVSRIVAGAEPDLSQFDLFYIGGDEGRQQLQLAERLRGWGPALRAAIDAGAALLAVGAGYQLLGRSVITTEREELPGAGLFACETVHKPQRLVGHLVVNAPLLGQTLVGFENHLGRTKSEAPLGLVRVGYGNNGQDHTEGSVYKGAVGTYLQGAVLPRNPWLTDWLLGQACEKRGLPPLAPLDDTLEIRAHEAVINRHKGV